VRYVTERGVFELRRGRVTLVEIAPGIEPSSVRDNMEFPLEIDDALQPMDENLFTEPDAARPAASSLTPCR